MKSNVTEKRVNRDPTVLELWERALLGRRALAWYAAARCLAEGRGTLEERRLLWYAAQGAARELEVAS